MALSFKLNNLEGVDDSVKGLYKQVDGVYILDVTGAESADDVQGLKNSLQAQKDTVATLRQASVDAGAAAAVAEQARLLEAGKHEELAANLTSELHNLKATNEAERQKVLASTKQTEALRMATEVGKDPASTALLARLFEQEMAYNEAGILQGTAGETLVQMLERVNKSGKYDSLISGSKASGATLHTAGGQGHKTLKEMSGAEETAFANEHPVEYKAMLNKV